jgi:hypothetical protein
VAYMPRSSSLSSLARIAATFAILAIALSINGCHDATFGSMKRSEKVHFRKHSFSCECAETIGCEVVYARRVQRRESGERKAPPLRSDVLKRNRGVEIAIPNFPDPAVVTWRSSDGESHRAEIDIGKIFRDRIAWHRVPVTEILGVNDEPTILLVVEDRTIRVYLKTGVWLNHEELPVNPYSTYREDVTLAFEKRY